MLHSEATKHHTSKEVSARAFSKVQVCFLSSEVVSLVT